MLAEAVDLIRRLHRGDVYVGQIGPDLEGFFTAFEKEVPPALC
ncbi:hypothetical protein [Nocardia nova]|nr:hypothetical protein [Nocardia nova]